MPRYALLSKGSYIETVQPPSMANRKTCQLKGFPTGELAPEASEEVQLSSGARFKGVNLAPKGEGVSVADGYSSYRAKRGFEVLRF